MFSHITLGANDIAATKTFYDAILGVIGAGEGQIDERGRLVYQHDGERLLITEPLDGNSATHGNGTTVAFLADSPHAVDAWHAAGLTSGGTTCEDPPGIRQGTGGRTMYLAYLRDPAGNKLCGFHKVSG